MRKINNFTKTLSLRAKVPNTYGARLYTAKTIPAGAPICIAQMSDSGATDLSMKLLSPHHISVFPNDYGVIIPGVFRVN